ncbi:hypothetical protein CNR22_17620 [Sphingobacteriaceae bacterium]|nr:hypothetical protein CNR22_17620 [Sphingobacteriaceae bacterium]
MTRIFKIFLLVGMILFSARCNTTKYLKPGEKLYTGAKITVNSNDQVNKKQIKSEMEKVLRPKPNQTILGIRFKLWFYYKAGENPKKKFKKMIKNKIGEPPVLYDPGNPTVVSDIMVNRLNNLGYFDANSRFEVKEKEKTVSVNYTVMVTKPYSINQAVFPEEKDEMSIRVKDTESETFIKPGVQYNLDLLKGERSRIDAAVKNEGFYYFNPDYILFKADTNLRNKTINVKVTLKKDIPYKATVRYYLNNIYINPSFRLKDTVTRAISDTVKIDGYYYLNKDSMFIPTAVTRHVFLRKNDPYSRKAYSLTVSRLMGMGVFRYVNVRFTDTIMDGVGRLNVYINMTPTPRRSLQLEVEAVTKSNNYTGPALTASYKNRNLFRGAELLILNLNTNYETQFSGAQKGLNSYEVGANTQLYLPQFVIPFVTIKNVSTQFVPRTKFDLGFRNLNRVQYFNMNAVNFSYGYTWKETIRKEHELNPIAINFARLINTTKIFDDLLIENPFLRQSFEEQFTLGGNYAFTYNSLVNSSLQHQYYFNITADISGNSAYFIQRLATGRRPSEDNPYTLFGYRYSQYSKISTDGRYHYIINKNSNVATRVLAGAGIPYGNSRTMPYIKQFFSGGSNSIRAFLPRTVGPGIYRKPDSLRNKAFLDQAGDIKFEANAEYRFTIISVLKGAVFLDAGNIWLLHKNNEQPGGEFNFSTFYKQLALGTGFGLRLDITYFVLRFDLGMPLRRPYVQENNGWVVKQINFRDRAWRGQNLVLNIAIGYPF